MQSGQNYITQNLEKLYRICLKLKARKYTSIDKEDFKDCFQEAVINVYIKLEEGVEIENVKSYLCKTVLNEIKNFLTKNKKLIKADHYLEVEQYTTFNQWTIDELYSAIEYICSKNSCDILRMALIEGMKPREIAEELGKTRKYIRQRLFKLKKKLREHLKNEYPTRF